MFGSFEFASYFGFTNSYTFRNWACRKQSVVWSLTIPTACMNAQVIVGPTKIEPALLQVFAYYIGFFRFWREVL